MFAAANPTLCLNTMRLIVKPSSAVVEILADAQYTAFLWSNGVETELTSGVVWSVSDLAIALIGAGSGNATGVAVGIVTVTATYGSLTGTARLEVIADDACEARANHFNFQFDVSRSSSAEFSVLYGTRLAVAKSLANTFIGDTDFTKDDAAVMSFDTTVAAVQAFTTNALALQAAVTGLASTQGHTDLATALEDANDYFDSQSIGATGRVIVLFTDGENNTGDDPVPVADAIRAEGTIIIVVGLRAKGVCFSLLERIASGGFFINVLPSNILLADGWLDGMRQYLCSGNCQPPGGVIVGVGELNFTGFINWDVIDGDVDLIGKNPGGTPLFDLLPGNGLYLDGCGSTLGPDPDLGTIRTKDLIPVTANKECSFELFIAGNQRASHPEDVTTMSVYDQTGALVATQDVSVTSYTQDFTGYTLDFTVPPGVTGVRLLIAQKSVSHTSPLSNVFGSLWDNVSLTNVTDGEVLFTDNFDNDNPQFIDPACSGSYGYAYYGYCYQGCAESVIPAQTSDPNPLPNMEDEENPPTFTSTKTATVCCPEDSDDCVTRSATATSQISQQDADRKAYLAAQEAAAAELACIVDFEVGDLINLQCNDNWQCVDLDIVNPCTEPSDWVMTLVPMVGQAAFGLSGDDHWNQNGGYAGGFFDPEILDKPNDTEASLKNSRGEWTRVELVSHDTLQLGVQSDPDHPSPLMRFCTQPNTTPTMRINVQHLPAGSYEFYLYAHGNANNRNTEITMRYGVFDPDGNLSSGTTCADTKSTVNGAGWELATWEEGKQFVIFRVTITAGQEVQFEFGPGASGEVFWNGLQIRRLGDDYNGEIESTYKEDIEPYPSEEIVECRTGTITEVSLAINGLTLSGVLVDFILESPSGTHVMVLGGIENTAALSNIVLDDDAGSMVPVSGDLPSGTYQPTQYDTGDDTPNAPCPLPAHELAMSAFDGEDANGIWKLYLCNRALVNGSNPASITSWALTITTA